MVSMMYTNFQERHPDARRGRVCQDRPFAASDLMKLKPPWSSVFEEALKDQYGPLGHIASMEKALLGNEEALRGRPGVNQNLLVPAGQRAPAVRL